MNKKILLVVTACTLVHALHADSAEKRSKTERFQNFLGTTCDTIEKNGSKWIKEGAKVVVGPLTTLDDLGTEYGPKTVGAIKDGGSAALTKLGEVGTTIKEKLQKYPISTGVVAGSIFTGPLVKLTTAQVPVLSALINQPVNSTTEMGAAAIRQLMAEVTGNGLFYAGALRIKNSIYRVENVAAIAAVAAQNNVAAIDAVPGYQRVAGVAGAIKRHPIVSVLTLIAADQFIKRYGSKPDSDKKKETKA